MNAVQALTKNVVNYRRQGGCCKNKRRLAGRTARRRCHSRTWHRQYTLYSCLTIGLNSEHLLDGFDSL